MGRNIIKSLFFYQTSIYVVFLLFLVYLSYSSGIRNFEEHSIQLATNQAVDNLNKDNVFRLWATQHGGVYVPINDRTPPNPLLKHLPNRDVETVDGQRLTLMNPAYMMRQMTEEYEKLYGVKGKITGQVLLDPEGKRNKPDQWEISALKQFDQGEERVIELAKLDGKEYLRMMVPMRMTQGCMTCHGHLGFEVGDIRGGVSMSIPLEPFELINNAAKNQSILSHIVILFIGLMVIFYFDRIKKIQLKRDKKNRTILKESESFNRMLFSQSPIGLMLTEMDGSLVDINQAYANIIGRDIEETLKLNYWDITPIKYLKQERKQLHNLEKKNVYGPYEKEFIHKAGHLVPVRLQGRLISRNEKHYIWSSVEDITVRKQVEDANRKSEKMYRMISEGAFEAILISENGICLEQNSIAEEMFGFSPSEAVGRPIIDWVLPDDQEKFNANMLSGEESPFEFIGLRKNGTNFLAESRAKDLSDSGKHYRITIVRDVTERKKTTQSLIRAQKMDALGQLTGGIAHDFNNILGVIIGNLELLELQLGEDSRAQQRISAADKAAKRAAHLTKQLLGFSRNQISETSIINLNHIINDSKELISRLLTPQIKVIHNMHESLWLCDINTGDFQDTLINLLINARDSMTHNGHVIIETHNAVLDENYCKLNEGSKPGEYVQIKISDIGVGISKTNQQFIYDPFYTTKPKGQGTGLGLSMVFGFVKRSGGYISVESELNVGTTFLLSFPRAQNIEDISTEVIENTNNGIVRGQETVMLVDDEQELVDISKQNLESSGYTVITARNGLQALTYLSNNYDVSLLISDVIMPGGINGYQLAEQASILNPELKILLVTGFTEDSVVRDGLEHHGMNLLMKPYTKTELLQRVRKVLDINEKPNEQIWNNAHQPIFIKWQPEFSVGVDAIDDDHRLLFSMLNHCQQAVFDKYEITLNDTLKVLENYVEAHFLREEKAMEICEYPQLVSHREAHKKLIVDFKHIILLNDSGKLKMADLADFLGSWLQKHILTMDIGFSSYIKSNAAKVEDVLKDYPMPDYWEEK